MGKVKERFDSLLGQILIWDLCDVMQTLGKEHVFTVLPQVKAQQGQE
jgi:hypothetical protein